MKSRRRIDDPRPFPALIDASLSRSAIDVNRVATPLDDRTEKSATFRDHALT